jgi:hypothetical protein
LEGLEYFHDPREGSTRSMAAPIQFTHDLKAPPTKVLASRAKPPAAKALGPQAIKDEIRRLGTLYFYGIPVRIRSKQNGKKETKFPSKWKHIITHQDWKQNIKRILNGFYNPNGIAILTGPSNLVVIDIDVGDDGKKRCGLSLWNKLIAEHTEPDTLKAISGNGGCHVYFRLDQSTGLKQTNNFKTLIIDGEFYRIDGRAIGGLIYAPPSAYEGPDGKILHYRWVTAPTMKEDCVRGMAKWLVDCVNVGRTSSGSTSGSNPPSERSSELNYIDSSMSDREIGVNDIAPVTVNTRTDESTVRSIACLEVQKLLQKKTNDCGAVYGGSTVLPNGNRSF